MAKSGQARIGEPVRQSRPIRPLAGASSGAMFAWAREHDVALGDFKSDFGYLPSGDEIEHELLTGFLPEVTWRYAHAA